CFQIVVKYIHLVGIIMANWVMEIQEVNKWKFYNIFFPDRLEPTNIKSLALIKALKKKRFVKVSAGSEHSVVLAGKFLLMSLVYLYSLDSGEVYTWGGDPESQLGQGQQQGEHVQTIPRLVVSLAKFKVTKITAGGAHTMVLTGLK